jgi:hypothetical protein
MHSLMPLLYSSNNQDINAVRDLLAENPAVAYHLGFLAYLTATNQSLSDQNSLELVKRIGELAGHPALREE